MPRQANKTQSNFPNVTNSSNEYPNYTQRGQSNSWFQLGGRDWLCLLSSRMREEELEIYAIWIVTAWHVINVEYAVGMNYVENYFLFLWFQTRIEFDHFNSKNIPQNILKTIWETSNDGIDILYIKKNRRIGGLDGAFCLFLPQGSKSLFAISNLAHFFSSYLELSHHALHFNSHGIKSTITSESINTRASCPQCCICLIKFHTNKSKGICWLPSLLYVWRVWKLLHVHRLFRRCYQ